MKQIDTDKIKNLTKEKIAYANFKKEEKMKKKKIAHTITFLFVLGFFICGTITVNAITDNKVVEGVKEALKLKINDKEYNSNCQKEENGMITCRISEEVTGTDTQANITISEENFDKVDVEYEEDEMKVNINE